MITKHKEGFTSSEIEKLLESYPNINRDKFNSALVAVTCIVKEGEIVIYTYDVENALQCGSENRDLNNYEWD